MTRKIAVPLKVQDVQPNIETIKQNNNALKLYSLSQAAKVMAIGRDSLRLLMAEGKIGYLKIGGTKKIPHLELLRFQRENIIHKVEPQNNKLLSKQDVNRLLNKTLIQRYKSVNGKEILEKIINKDNYGNSKNKR